VIVATKDDERMKGIRIAERKRYFGGYEDIGTVSIPIKSP